jgi:hypothetical protein
MSASVFVFNPFAEGFIARGKAFAPVKLQAMLAEDLANLPQFLCEPDDIVLLGKRPSAGFLDSLREAGFQPPEFVEIKGGRIDPADSVWQRKLDRLRPWAWAPDSVELIEPLFGRAAGASRSAGQCFNEEIARLYSKVWSAGFLRKVLAGCGGGEGGSRGSGKRGDEVSDKVAYKVCEWLCSQQDIGVQVDSLKSALDAIAAIRSRGHHRVVVKAEYSAAGQGALRLWEPEVLPAHMRWLARALDNGNSLVVEPWLEREMDFSVQLEMEPRGLRLCGYTGLVNDLKGQFLANWAEPDYSQCLPIGAGKLLGKRTQASGFLERYYIQIFSILEAELQRVGFLGPISIDALVYRTQVGECRLKPVVEINPRFTMGRVTLALMKHVCPGSCGRFRLVTRAQARKEGFADLTSYARALRERFPLQLEARAKIRQGCVCLNDPQRAQVVLATFEANRSGGSQQEATEKTERWSPPARGTA